MLLEKEVFNEPLYNVTHVVLSPSVVCSFITEGQGLTVDTSPETLISRVLPLCQGSPSRVFIHLNYVSI